MNFNQLFKGCGPHKTIKMDNYESDNIKLHQIARKCDLDATDVDFMVKLLNSNAKLQYNYIKQFSKYKDLTADVCSPRSLVKAIHYQQSTIDYLYSSHCILEDGYMKQKHPKKEDKNNKEDEKKKEEDNKTFSLSSFKRE